VKTIGLIGGLSWESSAHYYRIVNECVRARLGGVHSATCLMYSFDFDEIAALQHAGRWDEATARMVAAARALERGGADFLVICSNTMHLMAGEVRAAVGIPLLHIADPTAAAVRAAGVSTVGLLATRFTMEEPFYGGRLREQGLNVLVPEATDRTVVHDVIYAELVRGVVRDESRRAYRGVIGRLVERGAAGVILGCTEIDLLVGPADSPVPLFDTTRLHAEAAVEMALTE
jgi:aspartate racemase